MSFTGRMQSTSCGHAPAGRRLHGWVLALRACVLLLSGAAGLAGCASLPAPVPREATQAFVNPQGTALGKIVLASAPPQQSSGVRPLISGEDAFGSLVALADRAERTLDLQYYLIRNDASGRAVIRRVREAAERGVRVRLLIDDLNTSGEDALLLALTRYPNIQVRVYNPFPTGRFSTVSKVLASITDLGRINQRMHNKVFIADNAVAITGGRNLGDAYFLQSPSTNFVDLDVIAAGPVVQALSASFDKFWNNPLAYPIGTLASQTTPEELAATDNEHKAIGSAEPLAPAALGNIENNALARELKAGSLKLSWAPVRVLADQPSKIVSEGNPAHRETVTDEVAALIRSARSELIMISPYFVPGEEGVKVFSDLAARGVKLRVLTNSLATTDAPAVHIGYSRYRLAMLEMGTELHELRPKLGTTGRSRLGSFGSSHASLHAKALVLDRETVLVGSMNMDPRSANLNSEIGLVVRSPAVARQLVRLYEDVTRAGSYRVELTPEKHLRWIAAKPVPPRAGETQDPESPSGPEVLDDEPEASAWLKLILKLLTPFAPEAML